MEPSAHGHRAVKRRRLGWTLAALIGGGVVLLVVLWACISVLPYRLYPDLADRDLAGLTRAEQAERNEGQGKLQNDARTTALQALAALLVLVGAGIGATVTMRQVRTTREQIQAADQQAREQLRIAQEGQITERYTRAVDQLGHDQLDVRIGGIYALERIARDSPGDRVSIGEVLTAFVRGHAPWPPSLPRQYRATAPIDQVPELQVRAPDVQASLTVVGRGGFAPPQGENDPLDLRAIDVRRAHLRDVHLERALLGRAHLEWASLTAAHLQGANLVAADLKWADLAWADLEGASLTAADLQGANLAWANLKAAALHHVHLEGANLVDAHLESANLMRARLEGANLMRAHLEGANLTDAHLNGEDLGSAQFQEATADERTRWPAGFDWAAAGVTVTGEDGSASPP